MKSTVDEIRRRFDGEVERFSNLETGQAATIDAPLAMELITEAAVECSPHARAVLDIGCGAGNNTLKLVRAFGESGAQADRIQYDLLDLSRPMLARAAGRLAAEGCTQTRVVQSDFRDAELAAGHYDVILAAAVLHHLRDDEDWETAFQKVFHVLAPGGSFWVTDLVAHEGKAASRMMWRRYGNYLEQNGGKEYQERVFAYVEKEDTPRSLTYQLDLMRHTGFVEIDVLHKNSSFAAFGGRKPL